MNIITALSRYKASRSDDDFTDLARHVIPLVWRYCKHRIRESEWEDIAQEVLTELVGAIDRWNGKTGTSYIYGMARHRLNYRRRYWAAAKRDAATQSLEELHSSEQPFMMDASVTEDIEAALSSLAPNERKLILAAFGGRSREELAAELGMNKSTLNTKVSRLVERLRRLAA